MNESSAASNTKPAPELVEVKIDGQGQRLPKGMNLLEALLERGEDISYFCYHPGLSVAAACRQCLIGMGGRMVPSCQLTVQEGMEFESQSQPVLEARRAMLEFTLVNHPVDCVICDKAGECTLQRHYMDWDAKPSTIDHEKVRKPKKVDVGEEIVLDAERCILCSRCVRFCEEIAKEPELVFEQRGDHSVLTTAPNRRLDNAYSLNTVDICPVGALTDKDFRFKVRVWELLATQSVCNGCAAGCETEIHHHDGEIKRMVPPKRWDMNLNWMCNEGRRSYKGVADDRITSPLVDGARAELGRAIDHAAENLRRTIASDPARLAVVVGADCSNEDAYVACLLARTIECDPIFVAARDSDGRGDQILRSDDPNPNQTGVRAIAGARARSTDELLAAIGEQQIQAVYAIGDQLELDGSALAAMTGGSFLVVQATRQSELTHRANVVLPAACWAEVHGTITNQLGQVKRMRQAIEPPGSARPHWDLTRRLAGALGRSLPFGTPEAVFSALKEDDAFFANALWGEERPTTRLRFGGRRG